MPQNSGGVPVQIVISAVDQVTARVTQINEKLNRITAPAKKIGAALGALDQATGVSRVAAAFGDVASKAKKVGEEISGFVFKMGAVGALAGGTLFSMVKGFGEAGEEITTTANRLGLTTQAFQELSYAALQSNIGQEEFSGTLEKFTKNIAEAAVGSGDAAIGLQALGLNARDSTGRIRTLEDLLPKVADGLADIANQNLRNRIAAMLFGREGAKLNEFFKDGSKGIDELRAKARELGGVMTPDQLQGAKRFTQSFKEISFVLTGVRNVVASAVAPVLIDMMKRLQEWVLKNRDAIAGWAAQFADKLPGYLSQLANILSGLGGIVVGLTTIFNGLSSVFGEVGATLVVLSAWFGGGIVTSVFALISAITGLNLSLTGLIARAAIFTFGPAIAAIGNFILALRAGYGVVAAFNLVLAANPIGLVVMGLAALAGAALLVWKYWDPIKKLFSDLWEKIGAIFGWSGGKVDLTTTAAAAPGGGPAMSGVPMNTAAIVNANSPRAPAERNTTDVKITFDNMPKGTRVQSQSSTPAAAPDLSMGWAMM